MIVIDKRKGHVASLSAREIGLRQVKALSSSLAMRIAQELAKEPGYAMKLARKLKIHEQKIYYHIRKLEKAGVIELFKKEIIQGAQANFYKAVQPALVLSLKRFEESQNIPVIEKEPISFLEPFIEDGRLNAIIVVGSPDPHGPEKARSRDGYYAVDLSLFLGSFLSIVPDLNVKLDTEIRSEDLEKNLILVGGPVINTVTGKVNNRMPVRFSQKNNWAVESRVSGKMYHTDETGIIVRMKNPFNSKKRILVVAGKRYAGTKAVMIAFIKHFKEIIIGNKFDSKIDAKVVEGIDLDSDGIVDEIEILE